MVSIKPVSSLEKAFPDADIHEYRQIKSLTMLRNQRLSLQILYTETDPTAAHRAWLVPKLGGDLSDFCEMRNVVCVPVGMPFYPGRCDDNYLRYTPGLYPDLLSPLHNEGRVPVVMHELRSLWIDIDTCGIAEAGDHKLSFELINGDAVAAHTEVNIHIIDAYLPENTMYVTQWFHCDCLADIYNVPVFSERHWEIIESFARTAVRNGINTLLTPIFTPPLDTHIGGERPTVQLVGVTKYESADANGKARYEFDFSLLDRWVEMCDRIGVGYFEISHLFTQWGAAHAPKIVARVVRINEKSSSEAKEAKYAKEAKDAKEGSTERIFGWDTGISSADCEYADFLRSFLPAFIEHMKKSGNDARCIFHISDEPNGEHIEQYMLSKSIVDDLIKDYICIDALSNIDFWHSGAVKYPVAANNHIKQFLDEKVPGLWTYYCCGQSVDVSNRFLAMPGARTRILGTQCYKYDIAGFLQWGYNFYYNQGSYNLINPYLDPSCDWFVPAGDAFSVYPAPDGTAEESIRIIQFREGLDDFCAMKLCEQYYGRQAVIDAVEKSCGKIAFDRCPHRSEEMLRIRSIVDEMIEKAVSGNAIQANG